MAKILEFKPAMRELNGLTIYWIDKKTTQVVDHRGVVVWFHRWFIKSGYQNWKYFNNYLKFRNNINSIYEVTGMADYYEINMCTPRRGAKEVPPEVLRYPSISKHNASRKAGD